MMTEQRERAQRRASYYGAGESSPRNKILPDEQVRRPVARRHSLTFGGKYEDTKMMDSQHFDDIELEGSAHSSQDFEEPEQQSNEQSLRSPVTLKQIFNLVAEPEVEETNIKRFGARDELQVSQGNLLEGAMKKSKNPSQNNLMEGLKGLFNRGLV